jgi:hypothetical protein
MTFKKELVNRRGQDGGAMAIHGGSLRDTVCCGSAILYSFVSDVSEDGRRESYVFACPRTVKCPRAEVSGSDVIEGCTEDRSV